MIEQFKINFKSRDPKLKQGDTTLNSWKILSEVITDLNQSVETYSVVMHVMSPSAFNHHKRLACKFNRLVRDLTKRELEVLQLSIGGLGIKDISKELSISVDTVKTHRKKIICKADVTKIEEIKEWASVVMS